jgi:hypothetical protein
MNYLHNIEKSAIRPREYVGYAAGRVYRVRKNGCGGWEAIARDGADYQRADTLTALSAKLDKLGNAFFADRTR